MMKIEIPTDADAVTEDLLLAINQIIDAHIAHSPNPNAELAGLGSALMHYAREVLKTSYKDSSLANIHMDITLAAIKKMP